MNDDRHSRLVRRLRARVRRYRQVLDRVPDGIIIVEAGCITYANQTAVTMIGAASMAQMLGKAYADLVAESHGDHQMLRKLDGDVIEVDVMTRAFGQGSRQLTQMRLREVAASSEQLRQSQRMEAVGRLASGIAHDFNNLLTAIQGHAQFLAEDLTTGHPSRPDVDEILHSAERAAALTRQLLAFSRGQAVQPETIHLNNIIVAMERLLRRVISEDITVESKLQDNLWTVRADPTQIEQVLVNLMVNARDAMQGGGRITIRTTNVELAHPHLHDKRDGIEPGDWVLLSVSDTGVGMDRATQARIFEPFFTTKAPDKGTGLGLSTVYGIVKQMGGHIFVYSELGLGTTFKIYFPRAPEPMRGPAHSPSDRAHAHESVLIVEDDDSVRSLTRRVLDARGYRVWTCGGAQEAIDLLKEHGADLSLVITDVVMPEMSGQDLVQRVREAWPHIEVLFMSGYSDDDVRRRGMVSATDHFIEKPFTPDGLAHKVREVLDDVEASLPQNRR